LYYMDVRTLKMDLNGQFQILRKMLIYGFMVVLNEKTTILMI